jgi:predicted thioesterase
VKTLSVGQRGTFQEVVGSKHSAANFGNAGVEVLATPVLCHWFETTGVIAIHKQLEDGEATVGTRLSIEHLKATPIGMRVTVEAQVASVEGRRISFSVEARDELEVIARGTHERYVVDLDRFLQAVETKGHQSVSG